MLHDYFRASIKDLDQDPAEMFERIKAENPNDDNHTHYAMFAGALQNMVSNARRTAERIYEDWQKVTNRKDALEWAAEQVLNDEDVSTGDGEEVYSMLYAAADVIEHAINGGMNDTALRRRLVDEIEDDEIAKGCFIKKSERCADCDIFVGEETERCDECQEAHEEACRADAVEGKSK